jgi:uncharacterized RDD family membrane protein YckC
MIRHGNIFVCANCKPRFMQKLAEGAAVPGTVRYAGFWRRFLAYWIDAIILFGVNFILQTVLFVPAFSMVPGDPNVGLNQLGLFLGLYALQFAIAFTYETVLIFKYGATLGKLVCNLEVVTAEGRPLSYALSVGRFFAKILNSFTLLIGYIIAAFDDEKRGLHDRLCNTRVIIK